MDLVVWLGLGGVTAAWLGLTVGALIGNRVTRDLDPLRVTTTGRGGERVSVIVPVRDEIGRIRGTVERLLAQRDVRLEVVVVDDRSADGTSEALAELEREQRDDSTTLQVLRIDELPDGWLGKCHACWRGAEVATGDWLAFVDADTWLAPDVVARARDLGVDEGAAHVCILPTVARPTYFGRAIMLVLGLGILSRAWRAQRGTTYVGLGAFNMARRHAYFEVGGHEKLKLELIEDLRLGYLLHRAGHRLAIRCGFDDAEIEWVDSPRAAVRLLEKNQFAAVRLRPARLLAVLAVSAVVGISPLIAPFVVDGAWAWVPLAASGTPMVPAAVVARRYGWSWTSVLPLPFAFAFLGFCLGRSGWVTLRAGGVRWRETFYDLDTLRRGFVD